MKIISRSRGECARQLIGSQKSLFPHSFDINDDCRNWLNTNTPGWCWDHFIEEDEIEIHFKNKADAALFKLTWC